MDEQYTITITEVRYQRLVSFGNYQNEQIGATAAVLPGSDGTRELEALRLFVAQQITDHRAAQEARDDLFQTRSQLDNLRRELTRMADRHARAKAFLESLGISTADLRGFGASDLDEVPF